MVHGNRRCCQGMAMIRTSIDDADLPIRSASNTRGAQNHVPTNLVGKPLSLDTPDRLRGAEQLATSVCKD